MSDPLSYPTILPSRGVLYGDKLPEGKVDVRQITTREEKLWNGPGDVFKTFSQVLDRCLLTRSVPINDMLIGDRMWLLLHLRGISYGWTYEMTLRCSGCGSTFSHAVDISKDLTIIGLSDEDVEPFFVDLPVQQKKLGLRHLRVSDQEAINKQIKRDALRNNGAPVDGDPTYVPQLARAIVSVDGEPLDVLEAQTLVEDLCGADSLALRNAIDENECGVNLFFESTCRICGAEGEHYFEYTPEFFRPGITKLRRRGKVGS